MADISKLEEQANLLVMLLGGKTPPCNECGVMLRYIDNGSISC